MEGHYELGDLLAQAAEVVSAKLKGFYDANFKQQAVVKVETPKLRIKHKPAKFIPVEPETHLAPFSQYQQSYTSHEPKVHLPQKNPKKKHDHRFFKNATTLTFIPEKNLALKVRGRKY
jgi:hypothetical protein